MGRWFAHPLQKFGYVTGAAWLLCSENTATKVVSHYVTHKLV